MSNVWFIDFDNVLNALIETQLRDVQRAYGVRFPLEDVTHWNWWDDPPQAAYAPYVWDVLYQSYEWTLRLPPLTDAIASVKHMLQRGDDVYVVSDRRHEMADWIRDWLAQYDVSNVPILTTDRRSSVDKSALARTYGATHAVDDNPKNIVAYTMVPTLRSIFVMDYPYNRAVTSDRVRRVTAWRDVLAYD